MNSQQPMRPSRLQHPSPVATAAAADVQRGPRAPPARKVFKVGTTWQKLETESDPLQSDGGIKIAGLG
eukprot:2463535-Prymnesium_polylepis.1